MFKILIAEDDDAIRKLMTDILRENGYDPLPVRDGAEALDVLARVETDLLMLDVMMPGLDGFELTSQLRAAGYDMPILMVTAKEAQTDKKRGFLVGTDDYMVKPVDEEEMLLRIAALLRRSKIASERKVTVGGTTLVYDDLSVEAGGEVIEMPQKEFLLLFKLLSYTGKTFTRRQLMDDIWGFDTDSGEHTVNVHINRLRERFKENPDFEITTVRGIGYKAVKL